jgi:hypothetical protein
MGTELGVAQPLHRSRQTKRTEMRHMSPGISGDLQKLTPPEGAVEPIARPIPGNAQHGCCKGIVGHACQDMGVVMLDRHDGQARLSGPLQGQVIGMGITGDRCGMHVVEVREAGSRALKGIEGLGRLQIPEGLTDHDLLPHRHGDGVFQVCSHRQHWRRCRLESDGEGA